ncbi:hypothetical protein [uncultured Parabacteroides sp.]|jgi:hypothetical protein|uniref:hypothetical protein n=1 Tax=uncultured Parabacteroides sp. TaxID=512312 RepID=UPI0025D05D27|nr:hypothetical protein [uncultured Parabacteroides sp.]
MDANVRLEADKAMLVRDILNIEDTEIFNKIKRSFNQILKQESEKETISKEEILSGISRGLKEVAEAKRTGRKLKTLQEVIDEL